MRKQTEAREDWLRRRQIAIYAKELRNAGYRKASRRRALYGARPQLSVIPVPQFLTAERESHREEIGKAIRAVKSALWRPRCKVRLDFSKTEKIFPGGMLLLLAHLQLLVERHPGRITARCPPRSLAAQLLNHFGIAEHLGISDRSSHPTHDSVIHWRFCTGTAADGQKIAELLEGYQKSTCTEIPEGLYDVLTEALTNVRHHAYSDSGSSRVPEPLKRWWLFSRYVEPQNTTPGNLYIAVYDVGAGIQSTMRQRLRSGEIVLAATDELFGWSGFRQGNKRLHRLLLQRAVEHSRTSTGEDFRGKGLPEMREFVLKTRTGKLYIISGSAQYVCSPTTTRSLCVSASESVSGTLILWSIPLQYKEEL